MTAQQLKNSILQMAVQGKLVPQNPDDEPASVLLERIRAEKQKLIKEGKIKKDKKSSEIFRGASRNLPYMYYEQVGKEIHDISDEIPFDIPENWEWCRLGDILIKLSDGTHSTPKYKENGIPFISVKDVSSGKLDFSNCKHISENEHNELYERCNPEFGDILLTKVGTTGIPVIVDTNRQFSLFVSVALLKFNQKFLYNKYLLYLINSPLVQKQASENTKGVGNKNWVMRDIANTLIVIPPLVEQKRIVAKIEELLPYIEQYEKAETQLTKLNADFPEMLKKSILQEAVQGKLVPQNPDDEPASVLLERIRAEKLKLIKEGKIKKDKHESVIITRDKIPYAIPDSWVWCRLAELGEIIGGGTPKTSEPEYWNNGNIPWLTPADMKFVKGKYVNKGERFITENGLNHSSSQLMSKGTILYSSRAPIGYIAIAENDICTNQGFKSLVPVFFEMNQYLYYCLIEKTPDIQSRASGTTFKEISGTEFGNTLIPLPPLNEQERIVTKIEELMPFITAISK